MGLLQSWERRRPAKVKPQMLPTPKFVCFLDAISVR